METDVFQMRLNQIKFKECEDVNIGDIFHYELGYKNAKILKLLAGIGKTTCMQNFNIEFKGNNSEVLCLISENYKDRKEHLEAFDRVVDLLDSYVKVIPKKPYFCGFRMKNIVLPFIWCNQMNILNCSFKIRLYIARRLYGIFMKYGYVMKQCRKNHIQIKKVISYCDVMPEDSFFMQKLKKKKVMGITLQHGFLSPSINTWTCSGSYSDYFFADSGYSAEIVKEAGYKGKVFNVGSVHYVGKREFQKPERIQTEIIGMFLNSEPLQETNIAMIKLLQLFCKKTGKRLLIKFHPTSNVKEYEKILDKTIAKIYSTEISASDFGKMIDIAIISFSNTFIEMLNQWVPSFLYVEKNDILPFVGVDFLKFRTEDELAKLLEKVERGEFDNKIEQLRYYYCQDENLEKRYKKAFEKIGIQ